jgi:hypothetical protein
MLYGVLSEGCAILSEQALFPRAGMAELADAADSKSAYQTAALL